MHKWTSPSPILTRNANDDQTGPEHFAHPPVASHLPAEPLRMCFDRRSVFVVSSKPQGDIKETRGEGKKKKGGTMYFTARYASCKSRRRRQVCCCLESTSSFWSSWSCSMTKGSRVGGSRLALMAGGGVLMMMNRFDGWW
jgi:hypothetical protein